MITRDLDQLTVAEALPNGEFKLMVAVADVDALVVKGSALDRQAGHNTTSVYTAAKNSPCCLRNSPPTSLPSTARKIV